MGARLLRFLTVAVLLTSTLTGPALVPAVARSPAGCAAADAGTPHAGLVVDTGGATTTYCVALDASSVSGIHLVQLASAQYGLEYSLGFGGKAVCQLNGVGPSGGDCFADYPDFWGYWHGAGGGWTWSSVGAGSSAISSGDTDGWSWGTGSDGSTHPQPPATSFDTVCPRSSPSPSPTPTRTHRPGGGGSGSGSGNPSGTGTPGGRQSPSPPGPKAAASPRAGSTHRPSPTATPQTTGGDTPSEVAATPLGADASHSSSGDGPPVGVIAAVALIALLGVAGALRFRAGRRPEPPAGGGPPR